MVRDPASERKLSRNQDDHALVVHASRPDQKSIPCRHEQSEKGEFGSKIALEGP
jgi:hypothetical protein